MKQESAHDSKQIQVSKTRKQLENDLNIVVQRLKLLLKLQISSSSFQQQLQCLAQVNASLIQHVVAAFKYIRQDKQEANATLISDELKFCDRTIKLFQMKLIDTVEMIMQYKSEQPQPESAQEMYKQFYITCSEYMSQNYEHSNQLCLLLSQEVHAQSPNHKSVPNLPVAKEKKPTYSADYFLLKHLLEKISKAKKMYEEESTMYEKQLSDAYKQIEEKKLQISNLINSREQLVEDLSELEEALEKGKLEEARRIINKRNSNKQDSEPTFRDKIEDLKTNIKASKDQNLMKLQRELFQYDQQNSQLRTQLEQVKMKLQKYKEEIYRAAWIIQVQSRQLQLSEQTIKSLQTNKDPIGGNLNNTRNTNQIPIKSKIRMAKNSYSTRVSFSDAIFANMQA